MRSSPRGPLGQLPRRDAARQGPAEASASRSQCSRLGAALPDGQADRPRGPRRERDHDVLAALADDRQGPVPAFQAQRLDVRAGGFRDPQPVQGEQGDQGVPGGRAEPGGDQQAAISLRSRPVACDS